MSSTDRVMGNLNKKYKSFKRVLSCIPRGKKITIQELEEYAKCLNADNSALTQQLKETQLQLEKATQENVELKSDHETKEALFEEDKTVLKAKIQEKCADMEKMKEEISTLRREFDAKDVLLKEERELKESLKEKLDKLQQEVAKLNKDLEHDKMAQNQTHGAFSNVLIKEVDSLRGVLDMKHSEIRSMQAALIDAKQNEIALELSMRKMRTLRAKVEDMQEQLKIKTESERDLETEMYKLRRNVVAENSQNRRLSYQNEELNWKLKQKKVASERVRCSNFESPISLKVRKIVKKRRSVSYILDLEQSSKQNEEIDNMRGDVDKLFL